MTRLLTICLALAVCSAGEAATIRFVGDNDMRIKDVAPLNILGAQYRATFTHNVTFDEWLVENPSWRTFTALPDHISAAGALNREIAKANIFIESNYTRVYVVPWQVVDGTVMTTFFVERDLRPLWHSMHGFGRVHAPVAIADPRIAWVSFTVIPEPSSLILLAPLALAAIGQRMRFRG